MFPDDGSVVVATHVQIMVVYTSWCCIYVHVLSSLSRSEYRQTAVSVLSGTFDDQHVRAASCGNPFCRAVVVEKCTQGIVGE